jgi:hypothetical protein
LPLREGETTDRMVETSDLTVETSDRMVDTSERTVETSDRMLYKILSVAKAGLINETAAFSQSPAAIRTIMILVVRSMFFILSTLQAFISAE